MLDLQNARVSMAATAFGDHGRCRGERGAARGVSAIASVVSALLVTLISQLVTRPLEARRYMYRLRKRPIMTLCDPKVFMDQ